MTDFPVQAAKISDWTAECVGCGGEIVAGDRYQDVGERYIHDEEVEFQVLEPLCRRLTDPRYLPRERRGSHVRQVDALQALQF